MSTRTTPVEGSRVPISRELQDTRLIAILRARDSSCAEAVVDTLVSNGIRCLELTMTTPGALEVIERLAARLPAEIDLGMGTVLSAADVGRAADAGARFVVSPSVSVEVIETANRRGMASYPGAFTPTEIHAAWTAGASAVKLFPGGSLGPGYLSAVRGPLPDIPIVPTGSISLADIDAWFAAGAQAVGLGSPLIGDSMTRGGDLNALAERTRIACAAAMEGRR